MTLLETMFHAICFEIVKPSVPTRVAQKLYSTQNNFLHFWLFRVPKIHYHLPFLFRAPSLRKVNKMGLQGFVYNAVFKRTSTFLITIMFGTFIFERGTDIISKAIFEEINKGRLWKDIKHNYEK